MLGLRLQSTDQNTVAVMQADRLRMRAEVVELIAGARQTIAHSQALLIQDDAILANEIPTAKSERS